MTPPADRLPRTPPEHVEETARIRAREEGAWPHLPPPAGLALDSRRPRGAAPPPRESPECPRAAGYPGISDGP
ncbi:hypothetical protein ACIQU6_02800 [Streptomyces sp. NPDC090442]|uniref:hypothetical protein n=1 Tax=Streptomyces sp. NPDC090442 TaxID=3365962 RepID=UPI0038055BD5